jgi:hypothetical protein
VPGAWQAPETLRALGCGKCGEHGECAGVVQGRSQRTRTGRRQNALTLVIDSVLPVAVDVVEVALLPVACDLDTRSQSHGNVTGGHGGPVGRQGAQLNNDGAADAMVSSILVSNTLFY